jgi:hypothetical protein
MPLQGVRRIAGSMVCPVCSSLSVQPPAAERGEITVGQTPVAAGKDDSMKAVERHDTQFAEDDTL